jgi:hypothetical protein
MFLYDWTAFEVERRVCRLSDANIIRPAVEAGKDSQGPSRSHLAQCVAHCLDSSLKCNFEVGN